MNPIVDADCQLNDSVSAAAVRACAVAVVARSPAGAGGGAAGADAAVDPANWTARMRASSSATRRRIAHTCADRMSSTSSATPSSTAWRYVRSSASATSENPVVCGATGVTPPPSTALDASNECAERRVLKNEEPVAEGPDDDDDDDDDDDVSTKLGWCLNRP